MDNKQHFALSLACLHASSVYDGRCHEGDCTFVLTEWARVRGHSDTAGRAFLKRAVRSAYAVTRYEWDALGRSLPTLYRVRSLSSIEDYMGHWLSQYVRRGQGELVVGLETLINNGITDYRVAWRNLAERGAHALQVSMPLP